MLLKTAIPRATKFGVALTTTLILAACGGGSGSSSTGGGAGAATVSGTALGGRFLSGQVCAYQISGGTKGAQIACATINPTTSTYQIAVSNYSGDVLLEIAGNATYDDEANPNDNTTGTAVANGSIRSISSVSGSGTISAALTPFTEAAIRSAGSLNKAAILAAGQQIRTDLGLDSQIDFFNTQPDLSGTAGIQIGYREALRGLSQLQYNNPSYQGNLGSFLDYVAANHSTLQTQFQTELINGLAAGCAITNNVLTCATSGSGGGGGGGGGGTGSVGGGNIGGGGGTAPGGITTALPATPPTITLLSGSNPSASIAAAWATVKPALQAPLNGNPAGSYISMSVDYTAQTFQKSVYTDMGGYGYMTLGESGALGADGQPNTADDVPTSYIRNFYPNSSTAPAGYLTSSGFVVFSAPGADGLWHTADDLASSSSGTLSTLAGNDGAGHQLLILQLAAGADRVFFTADDTPNSGYDFISLDANGHGAQDVHYAGAGADGQFFTADDAVGWYTVFNVDVNGNAVQTMTYNGKGADGQWFTADDVVQTATAGVISGGKLTHVANFGPGTDNVWFTADDVVTGLDYYFYDAAGRVKLLVTHASAYMPATAVSTLYDAAGHPVQVATILSAGADGQWGTGDDTLMTNTVKEWDATGHQVRQVQYNGKGIDGQWFTADDVVTPTIGYWYAAYDANGKETLRITYTGPGADGIAYSADDVVANYAINRYAADGSSLASFLVSNMGPDQRAFTADDVAQFGVTTRNAAGQYLKSVTYKGPGADGVYFTADDTLAQLASYTYNAQNKTASVMYATGAGADGVWGTADDTGYFYTYSYDAQGRNTGYAIYSAAGSDGVWGTADDVLYSNVTISYDAAGNTTEVTQDAAGAVAGWNHATLSNSGLTADTVYYTAAGADGQWQTADDVVGGQGHIERSATGQLLAQAWNSGAGADGILHTADDYSSYTRTTYDAQGMPISAIQYSGAGADGVWFTADDVKSTEYFYLLPAQ